MTGRSIWLFGHPEHKNPSIIDVIGNCSWFRKMLLTENGEQTEIGEQTKNGEQTEKLITESPLINGLRGPIISCIQLSVLLLTRAKLHNVTLVY